MSDGVTHPGGEMLYQLQHVMGVVHAIFIGTSTCNTISTGVTNLL